MKLSDTNEQIKSDLMRFVNGEYDNYFTNEQIKFATELSFLLNHINQEGDSIIFSYNNYKIKISGLHDNPVASEESILSYIKNEDTFKKSYKSFLREHKLNKLLNE